jgi:hypothetical protein
MGKPIIDFPKNAEFAPVKILPLLQRMPLEDALTILDAAKETLLHLKLALAIMAANRLRKSF